VAGNGTVDRARVSALVEELERLSRWLGREEPRRHELQHAVDALQAEPYDATRLSRALLRCAVTVDRMYSSSLKRLIKAKIVELSRTLSDPAHAR
jgi:hypothetical protein